MKSPTETLRYYQILRLDMGEYGFPISSFIFAFVFIVHLWVSSKSSAPASGFLLNKAPASITNLLDLLCPKGNCCQHGKHLVVLVAA